MTAAERGPLAGRRVLVTRATGQSAGLSAGLIVAGAAVVEVPLIAIERVADDAEIRAAHERLRGHSGDRWVVFTSVNAVRVVTSGLVGTGDLAGTGVVAVGERTGAALAAWGRTPDLIPSIELSDGVAAAMIARGVDGSRVWLPRGDLAGHDLPDALRRAGAHVDCQVVYRTTMPADASDRVAAAGHIDAVTLTSASAVAGLIRALAGRPLDPATIVACIGRMTADAAVSAGFRVDATASSPGCDALVAALAHAFAVQNPAGHSSTQPA